MLIQYIDNKFFLPGLFFYCVCWAFSEIRPSWFSSRSIIIFDLGIIRRPDHCSDCLLPVSTKHLANAGLTLAQRRRRWGNVNPTLVQGLVFTVLSSIWPVAKHYLEATNRRHWSSISVMYFQRFRRWPIFNQLRANVACFLANNAWYPYVWEHLRDLNRGPALNTLLCVTDRKRGRRLYLSIHSVHVPKTKTRPYKAYVLL